MGCRPESADALAKRRAVNVLSKEKQSAVIAALCEGVSLRTVSRLHDVHRDTAMRLTAAQLVIPLRVLQTGSRRSGEVREPFFPASLRELNAKRIDHQQITGRRVAEALSQWELIWKCAFSPASSSP
jgi:hypothetical protein